MRKLLLALSLFLVFMLPGCSSSTHNCTISGLVPGATYLIVTPNNMGALVTTATATADSNGSITIRTTVNCGSLGAIRAFNSNLALSASPSSVDLLAPPATATITGQSFDATYGMPRVDYFDGSGYLVGTAYATSVSSDGTWLQANMPDLSYVYSGTYQVKVTNKTYEGYYAHIVGYATMTGWGRDRVDSDGDGYFDDQDCAPYDPYRNYDCSCNSDDGDRGYTYDQPIEFCPYY
jgi:hypothetical protein